MITDRMQQVHIDISKLQQELRNLNTKEFIEKNADCVGKCFKNDSREGSCYAVITELDEAQPTVAGVCFDFGDEGLSVKPFRGANFLMMFKEIPSSEFDDNRATFLRLAELKLQRIT